MRGKLTNYEGQTIGDLFIVGQDKSSLSRHISWHAICNSTLHPEPKKFEISSARLRYGASHCGCRGANSPLRKKQPKDQVFGKWRGKKHPSLDAFLSGK